MTDDELREQLALSAVGALTEAEQKELADVLRTRPDLQGELDELHEAAAVLADAVAAAPPTGLRSDILGAIAGTPQLPRVPSDDATPRADRPMAPVVPIGSGRRRNRFVALSAAAAAVVVVTAGVLVVAPWDGGETDPVAEVLESEDARRIPMPGALGELTIVHSPGEDAAVLVAQDVPVPAEDRVYELWAIRGGTPERVTTFRPDAAGRLSVYAPGLDPASAERWAITEEPAGGSDTPTLPILNAT